MRLRTRLGLTVLVIAIPLVAGLLWLREEMLLRQIESSMSAFVVAHMDDSERAGCEASPETYGSDRARGTHGRRPPPPPPPPGAEIAPGEDDATPEPPPAPEGERAGRRGGRGRRGGARGRRSPRDDGDRRGRFAERPRLFAYSSGFVSFNPEAPEFPAAVRAALERGDDIATAAGVAEDGREMVYVGVRLPPPDSAAEGVTEDGPCAVILVRRPDPRGRFQFDFLMWGALGVCGAMLCAVLFAAGPIVRRIRRLTGEVRTAAGQHYGTQVTADGSDEIAELGRAFNEAGAEVRAHIETLGEREQTLRAFLANTTHDVMIPLTVLQGHLTALRDVSGSGDETHLRGALEESHYIASLLQNLAAAAKLEAGEQSFHTAPVNLSSLIDRVAARHQPVARQAGVELDFAVPPDEVSALADVTLLEQAVSNLVHNAVRYNERGGHVAITLETAAQRFTVRVVDDGPGIPPGDLARVTEPRFRSEAARTREASGQGLGLHIASDVAERHGFELSITNREPHGVEATLSGPLRPAPPPV